MNDSSSQRFTASSRTNSQLTDFPDELLIEIFRLSTSGDLALTPLTLCKVCHRWRQIAFEDHELWGEVNLLLERKSPYQIPLLEEWIERGRHLPLAISISDPKEVLETDKRLRKSLVPALQMGSSRISSMKLELPERVFRAIAASTLSLPILSELRVSATDQKSLPLEKEVIVTNFINSPLLSTVRIRDIWLESFEFRWENLLHLYLDNQPPSQMARALTLAPNLHTLHATQIVEGCGDVPFHMEPHSKLQHIKFSEFYDDGDGDGWNAFNGLNLPGLKTLELIMGSEKPIVGHWNSLFPSIGGVSNLLQELSISCAGLQEPDVLGALASFSDLRILKLHDNIWYRDHEVYTSVPMPLLSDLVLAIAGSQTRPPIVPNLKVFELEGSEVDFSPQVVFDALEARWSIASSSTGGCPMFLESFTFSVCGDLWELMEEHRAMAEMWMDRGLKVAIGLSKSKPTFASLVTNLFLRGLP